MKPSLWFMAWFIFIKSSFGVVLTVICILVYQAILHLWRVCRSIYHGSTSS